MIAWANERHFDDGTPARMWQVHLAEIERQAADWRRIRELHPDLPLVVLGDFNQDRDGSGWYGTAATRAALGAGLEAADLICITEDDAVAESWLQRALRTGRSGPGSTTRRSAFPCTTTAMSLATCRRSPTGSTG